MEIELRPVEQSDIDFILSMENDREAMKYSDNYATMTRKQIVDYVANYQADPFRDGQLRLVAWDKETGERAGLLDFFDVSPVHLHASVGIIVSTGMRGKGIGREIISTAVDYARDAMMMRTLLAMVAEENEAALRIFRRNGFKESGKLPQWWRTSPDTLSDCILLVKCE